MRIRFAILRVIVFVFLVRTCSFAEAQKIVKRVVIHSSAGGLGGALSTRVVVQRKGDKFLSNGQPVSVVQVQSLVEALSAAPMTRLDLKNLGITDEWLAAKVESQQPRNVPQSQLTASQKFFITFTLIDSVLPNLLTPQMSDYSAYCSVEIVFDDGSKLSVESDSYSVVFMLPWSTNGRRGTYTYNADISRAIAALLPAGSPQKTTLAGDELDTELTAIVKTLVFPR